MSAPLYFLPGLEIIWRVACCRDRPPATPRLPENRPNETDNLHGEEAKERGAATLVQLSLDGLRRNRVTTNLCHSLCANHVRNRFHDSSRIIFISSTRGEREARFQLKNIYIYIYISRGAGNARGGIFGRWNRFGIGLLSRGEM